MQRMASTLCKMFLLMLILNFMACGWNTDEKANEVIMDYASDSVSRSLFPSTGDVYDISVFGNLITEITSAKFKIPVVSIHLFNDSAGSYSDPVMQIHYAPAYLAPPDERFYADFLNALPITYTPEVVQGVFNSCAIMIPFSPGLVTYGREGAEQFSWHPVAEIEFQLPFDYDLVPLELLESWVESPDNQNMTYLRKTGHVIFANGLSPLYGNAYGYPPPQLFIFDSSSDPSVYNQEMASINPSEIFNSYCLPSNTNGPILRLPFSSITIPEEFDSLSLSFTFDLNGILQLYDNNTPENLADDIIVLAPRIWERISLTAAIE